MCYVLTYHPVSFCGFCGACQTFCVHVSCGGYVRLVLGNGPSAGRLVHGDSFADLVPSGNSLPSLTPFSLFLFVFPCSVLISG